MSTTKDSQRKRYLLTINNPLSQESGEYTHEKIKEILRINFQSIIYYCLADECGDTPHTHVFVIFSGGIRFSTLKKHFPTAHIDTISGTNTQTRDYVAKLGKWADDEKGETVIDGTFEEYGEMPKGRKFDNIETEIVEKIKNGATNAELLDEFPKQGLRGLRDWEHARQTLRAEEYRNVWRNLETVYIFGATGTGKTRFVMDGFGGYSNVYAVNNYKHPFDGYAGESVMLFDEFSSNVRIQDMNNYLDGYPIALPARYSNKQACYEQVFIISNIPLKYQYTQVQEHFPEIWNAFLRRIHRVIHFHKDGSRHEYITQNHLSKQMIELDLADE